MPLGTDNPAGHPRWCDGHAPRLPKTGGRGIDLYAVFEER